jgi:hypothetical protein
MSPSCAYFRIFIARKYNPHIVETNLIDRSDFIEWMSNANKNISRKNSIDNNNQDEGPAKKDVPEDTISIASVQQIDPFNRESASRKSFSEKGPFGMRVDPSKFENFKQISHQRQISGKYLHDIANLLCSNQLFEFTKLTFAFVYLLILFSPNLAPTIGHRKQRANFRRQHSAVILKNNTAENQIPKIQPTSTEASKQHKGFSFLSFLGLRNSTKNSSTDKENIQDNERKFRSAYCVYELRLSHFYH